METHGVPGVAVGVLTPEAEAFAGFGVGSLETRTPIDESTIIQCGSISKVYTATSAMLLVEQGKLALDAPVHDVIPDLALADEEVARTVTLRHLLTHTAGWHGDYIDDHGRGEDALARYVADFTRMPQIAPLGHLFSYNNAAFALVGRLIEVVWSKPYETALRELLLDPLDMTETWFFARDVITRRFAVGHVPGNNGPRVAHGLPPFSGWELPGGSNPAGGVAPSIRDLMHLARFHLGDGATASGERILQPATLRAMQSAQFAKGPASAPDEQMGFGWHISAIAGEQILAHAGGTQGFLSSLTLVPARGFAVGILTNSASASPLLQEITDRALKLFTALERRPSAPRADADGGLAAYEGRYLAPGFHGWEFTVEDSTLTRRMLDGAGRPRTGDAATVTRMQPFAAGRFLDVDGQLAGRGVTDILRADDGSIGWARIGGRAFPRVVA
jgi:CubicO group peptidase (beta-lactamase class C family)